MRNTQYPYLFFKSLNGAHNPKVGGSNPSPATKTFQALMAFCCKCFFYTSTVPYL